MAKFRSDQTSFVAGEISPTALGRTDLPAYKHGCKTLRNMIPFATGGAYRRPGTLFHRDYPAADFHAPRVFPFIVSESEAYALVFSINSGNGIIDIIRPTDNTISAGLGGFVTGHHPYLAAVLGDISGGFYPNGYYDEWHDVQMAQSVDVMTMVHPNHKPQRLYRTGSNAFTITEFDHDSTGTQLTGTAFRDAWPYLNKNITATTLTINTATVGTGRTLTASASLFTADHVGAVFKVFDGGTAYGCALVTAYVSATQVTVKVIVAFGDTAAHANWWESAWSDEQGWPRTVGFFQGRICYGGCLGSPDSIWHSQTNNFDVMSHQALVLVDSAGDGSTTGPTGSNAFTATISSQKLDVIQWMSPERTLAIGTGGAEWILDRFDQTSGYGANNIIASIGSHFGSAYRPAVRVGSEVIFDYQSDHELKSLVFNLVQNSYVDESLQLLYDEFPFAEASLTGAASLGNGNRKYRGFTWDGTRKTLWAVDTMGNFRGMTRDRNLQITAWHSHQFGGYDATKTGGTTGAAATLCVDPIYSAPAGSVTSVAIVPNPVLGVDDVWIIVKRYVNGAYHYHLERMIGENYPLTTAYAAPTVGSGTYLVDAAVFNTNDYPLTETFRRPGLEHLVGVIPVGTSFNVYGVFYTVGDAVTAGGVTTVQHTYPTGYSTTSTVTVFGLEFSSIIEPVRLEAGSQIGTAQGAIKRIHEITTRFYRTMFAKVGRDADNLIEINFRTATQAMGLSAELYTGDKVQKFPGNYDRDGYVYILCDRPLPFAVTSLVTEGMTSDGG